MLDYLDSNSGPGYVLRRSIASTVLDYRMLNRLLDLMSTLRPTSFKYKRVVEGIAYLEERIKTEMFYFEAWTFFSDDPGEVKSNLSRQKIIDRLLRQRMQD
jgi:hypothetical protein